MKNLRVIISVEQQKKSVHRGGRLVISNALFICEGTWPVRTL